MDTDETHLPRPWFPVVHPATGRPAVAIYLRAHLYGAAVGRRLLDRLLRALDEPDRVLLRPLRAQFDDEIATARRVLADVSPVGTPGRTLVGAGATAVFGLVPAGPRLVDPLARLALLEALRTLVVAKRSMWTLLARLDSVDPVHLDDLLALAEQAETQEQLLESLRLAHGRSVMG